MPPTVYRLFIGCLLLARLCASAKQGIPSAILCGIQNMTQQQGEQTYAAPKVTRTRPVSDTVSVLQGFPSGNYRLRARVDSLTVPDDPYFPVGNEATNDYLIASSDCSAPVQLTEATSLTAARLSWEPPAGGGRQSTLQWRLSGSDWLTVPDLSGLYFLTGLTPGRTYEWRVASKCSASSSSDYSPVRSFTTQCSSEFDQFRVSDVSATGAAVYWQTAWHADGYVVRWRPSGSSGSWIEGSVVQGFFNPFDGTPPMGTFTILGLNNATQYAVQIRKQCAGSFTDWVAGPSFTTNCNRPSIFVSTLSPTSARLQCSFSPGSRYVFTWSALTDNAPVNSLTTNTPVVMLTDLTPNTGYTFRVRTVCADNSQSDFSPSYTTSTPPGADLSLQLVVNNRTPDVNEPIIFTLLLLNSGPQPASTVQITSLLPPNMTYLGSSHGAVTYTAGKISIDITRLDVSTTSESFSFSVLVSQPGHYRMAAQVSQATPEDLDSYRNSGTSDGDDDMAIADFRTREAGNVRYESPNPNPRELPATQSNQPLPASSEADLSLQLVTSAMTFADNDNVSLSIVVTNRGGLPATNVMVALILPAGWIVTNQNGLSIREQTVLASLGNVPLNKSVVLNVSVRASGLGEQMIRALITSASEPDSDSPHSELYGLGEDDEAMITVRGQ